MPLLAEQMLPEDRGGTQRLDSRCRSLSGGLGGDRLDQLRDPLTVLLLREIPPTGLRRESHESSLVSEPAFLPNGCAKPISSSADSPLH